jgi:hypothetical protein
MGWRLGREATGGIPDASVIESGNAKSVLSRMDGSVHEAKAHVATALIASRESGCRVAVQLVGCDGWSQTRKGDSSPIRGR